MDHHAVHEVGCLCGAVRYRSTGAPLLVNFCHCTFCQRVTGTAFLVEPVFAKDAVQFSGATPRTYDHRSAESGKRVTVNFCGRCGTSLYYDLERFPEKVAIFAGTYDDPNWFAREPGTCQHIFTRSARHGLVLPAHVPTYAAHRMTLDGTPNQPVVHGQPVLVGHGAQSAATPATSD